MIRNNPNDLHNGWIATEATGLVRLRELEFNVKPKVITNMHLMRD